MSSLKQTSCPRQRDDSYQPGFHWLAKPVNVRLITPVVFMETLKKTRRNRFLEIIQVVRLRQVITIKSDFQ